MCFLTAWEAQSQMIIYTQDFEAGTLPPGWTQQTNASDGGWLFGDAAILESNYFPILPHTKMAATNDDGCNCDKSNDYLITQPFDFSMYTAVFMRVEVYYFDETYQGSQETAKIEVSVDSGQTWNQVVQLAGSATWQSLTVNLSAYAGQPHVLIAFHYSDGGGWLYGWAIDDMELYQPAANDAAMTDLSTADYVTAGNYDVSGTVTNEGSTAITSLDVNWKVNNGTTHTHTFTGLNIPPLGSWNFVHPDQLNIPSPGAYQLEVWVSNPNGNTDQNTSNDAMSKLVSGLSSIPTKNVVLEEFTGAWCGWCPDGALILNQILDDNANAIGVSVHAGDDMEFTEGGDLANEYAPFYPSGMIDRFLFEGEAEVGLDRGTWITHFDERSGMIVPVSVSLENVSFDSSSRQLSADVKATFVGPVQRDLRLNLFITEDKVTGVGQGYDQRNYYSNNPNFPNHPFYNQPDPIVGYEHNHTLRAMMGGTWGDAGIIPSSVNDGESYSKTYTTTLPVGWDFHQVHIVGLVQEFDPDKTQRNIYNAESMSLMSLFTGIEEAQASAAITRVYPNPVTELTQIDFYLSRSSEVEIGVYDLMGRKVNVLASGFMGSGFHSVPWSGTGMDGNQLESGLYMIRIVTPYGQATRQVVVAE